MFKQLLKFLPNGGLQGTRAGALELSGGKRLAQTNHMGATGHAGVTLGPRLINLPPDGVAGDGAFCPALGDDRADSVAGLGIGGERVPAGRMQHKMRAARHHRLIKALLKLGFVLQSSRYRLGHVQPPVSGMWRV